MLCGYKNGLSAAAACPSILLNINSALWRVQPPAHLPWALSVLIRICCSTLPVRMHVLHQFSSIQGARDRLISHVFLHEDCCFVGAGIIRKNALYVQSSSSFFPRSFYLLSPQIAKLGSKKFTLQENGFDCLVFLPTFASSIFDP